MHGQNHVRMDGQTEVEAQIVIYMQVKCHKIKFLLNVPKYLQFLNPSLTIDGLYIKEVKRIQPYNLLNYCARRNVIEHNSFHAN